MSVLRCVKRIKDNNGRTLRYILLNELNFTIELGASDLKQYIKEGYIEVENLTLTRDGRLIDKVREPKLQGLPKSYSLEEVERMVGKGKLFGKIQTLKTPDSVCYLLTISNIHHILYIPDNVSVVRDNFEYSVTAGLSYLHGHLQVVGGKNVTSYTRAFVGCSFDSVDFSLMNTNNAVQMESMFENFSTSKLNLSNFNTSKVKNMRSMFYMCNVDYLDISTFNMNKVDVTGSMFSGCQIRKKLILPNPFDISHILNVSDMFRYAYIKDDLDISNWKMGKAADSNNVQVDDMFSGCNIKSVTVSKEHKAIWNYLKKYSNCKDIRIV